MELYWSIIFGKSLKDKCKLWILQHLLIPWVQWPLLIYEFSISLEFKLKQKAYVFIRKWLHLHHSTSSLCFYSSASPCPLSIKSLSSALKASKISGHLLLRNSQGPLISSSVPKLQTGAWKVEDTVLSCESEIKFNKICGSQYNNRLGFGYTTIPKSQKTNLQKTTGDVYQTTTEQLMTLIPCPKLSNCRFRVSGRDG